MLQAKAVYYVAQLGGSHVLRALAEARARLRGHAFSCAALAGRSTYNVSVNSDMTVSCSCQDRNGAGVLGDLRTQSFEEIWSGPVARRFREQLAAGRLPISYCARCCELTRVTREQSRREVDTFGLPRGLMVENTVSCQLHCTSCHREPLRARHGYRLTREDVRLVADTLRRLDCRVLAYFKLGEPFLSPSINEELAVIRERNPRLEIHCSTNGLAVTAAKLPAALAMDMIVFSIDGTDTRMVRRYQRGHDFDRAFENMAALVKARGQRDRPIVVWRYVLFRWNDSERQLDKARRLAREAGVDFLNLVPTVTPPWAASWRPYLTRRFAPDAMRTGMGLMVPVAATTARLDYIRAAEQRWHEYHASK